MWRAPPASRSVIEPSLPVRPNGAGATLTACVDAIKQKNLCINQIVEPTPAVPSLHLQKNKTKKATPLLTDSPIARFPVIDTGS